LSGSKTTYLIGSTFLGFGFELTVKSRKNTPVIINGDKNKLKPK
jgi:hypothetical protein